MKQLRFVLRSLDSRMQALGAIEKRRERDVSCPHCQHEKASRWGSTRTGIQRMRCAACRRTFSSSTGTAVAGVHSPARFHQVVADMFSDHPRSCRRLAKALDLDKMTIWRWRQKIIRVLSGAGADDLGGVVEADEKFFRESRKGSREWVRHRSNPARYPQPPRTRWVDYKNTKTKLPAGVSQWQIPVLTMADRAGARRADVMPNHSAPPLMAVLARRLRSDVVLCSDGDTAYDFFARQNNIPHYRIDAKNGPFVIDKAFHIQTVNSLHSRFEDFMRPFRGPATKNLPGYASWFIARSVRSEPERIEDAWDRLMAA